MRQLKRSREHLEGGVQTSKFEDDPEADGVFAQPASKDVGGSKAFQQRFSTDPHCQG